MAKKKFIPILTDLALLKPAEVDQYILDVCEFLQVPPELGLIRVGPMDSGDGARKTVLYVQKGATDIIRDRRGINVDEMTQITAPDIAGWTVKGHDKSGRTEIAVGTVSTKGLTGKSYADAFMFAQTKACRRLTLQFAGGGFLDESEVTEKTTNLSNATSSLKEIAQPKVVPNTEAGKDITDASKALTSTPAPASTPSSEPSNQTTAPAAEAPKKKRGRPRRNSVSLDAPGNSSVSEKSEAELEPRPEPKSDPKPEPVVEKSTTVISHVVEGPAQVTEPIKTEEETPIQGTKCTEEQKADFRKRFSLYVNDTLPKAGFLQSEKFGGRNEKLKLFVAAMFPKADVKRLSFEQWTYFFNYMDTRSKDLESTKKLVNTINYQLGDVQ
jgi:hypothetical protein